MNLSKTQLEALEVLKSNTNCFITGVAGTGKSFLIDYYTSNYCQDKLVAKVAFTAAAVTNLTKDKENDIVGTIHSVFNITSSSIIDTNTKPSRSDIKHYYSKIDVLIIDEISMVRIDYFEYIARLINKANSYRKTPIQLIVVGDFDQLPPIVTANDKQLLLALYNTSDGYAFESSWWKSINFTNCILTDQLRNDNSEYNTYLNNLRYGKDIDNTITYFNKFVDKKIKPGNGIVEVYATNSQVDKVNAKCLKALDGKEVTIHAYYDNEILDDIKHKKLDDNQLPCELTLSLKPNAQVMFIRNDKIVENKRRFVNGDIATVISCSEDEVVVRLLRTNKLVHLHKYNCSFPIYHKPKLIGNRIVQDEYLGLFKQYPLRLAYALTIHKTQGKTFDNVHFDPQGSRLPISLGQLYVALSRVKDPNQIKLYRPIKLDKIVINDKVIEFNRILYNIPLTKEEMCKLLNEIMK